MAETRRACRLPARLPRHLRHGRDRGGRPCHGRGRGPGASDHRGFLCGKVSNYLDRVYAEDRILHPLVRDGAKGEGAPRGLWDEALDRVAGGLPAARRARRRGDPPVQLRGHPGPDPGQHDERARDERAGRERARAHDLRDGGDRRHGGRARDLARGGPRGVAARPPPARLGLEPDVHGAPPLAQAARGAPGGRPARGGGPVPQPHRARGGRAPCAAAGHRRGAGDRDDARGRGRRPPGRGLVPAHAEGYDELLATLAEHTVERCAEICGVDARRSPAPGASSPRPGPRSCGWAWERSATWARRRPTARSPRCPSWPGRGGSAAAAAPTSPPPRPRRDARPLERRRPAPGAGAHDQHVPARRRAHRPRPRPAREGARRAGTRTRPRSPPIRSACSRGCTVKTCSRSCSSSS